MVSLAQKLNGWILSLDLKALKAIQVLQVLLAPRVQQELLALKVIQDQPVQLVA